MEIETIKIIDSYLASIKSILLLNKNDEESVEYISWIKKLLSDSIKDKKEKELLEKIKKCPDDNLELLFELHNEKKAYLPSNYPYNLKKGDIAHINYGYGYCSELSNGHYGIILSSIKANMYLVLPLSSEPLKIFNVSLKSLKLPNSEGLKNGEKLSYLRFDQLGYIHYRRIERIIGIKDGVVELDDEDYNFVTNKLIEFLGISIKISIDK